MTPPAPMTVEGFRRKWGLLEHPGLFTDRQSRRDLKAMLRAAKWKGRIEGILETNTLWYLAIQNKEHPVEIMQEVQKKADSLSKERP